MCTHLLYHAFGEDSTRTAHDGTKFRARNIIKLSNARYRESPIQTAGSRGVHHVPRRHVVLWAQRVPQGLSTKYTGLFLLKVGYVQAVSDEAQLWRRDLPMELQNVGVEHGFSCFMPVNMDCTMDGRENMFVYGSSSGVPYPRQAVSMSMLAGDLWIFNSYVIHRGGALPREAPAGSSRIIAFAANLTACRNPRVHCSRVA